MHIAETHIPSLWDTNDDIKKGCIYSCETVAVELVLKLQTFNCNPSVCYFLYRAH